MSGETGERQPVQGTGGYGTLLWALAKKRALLMIRYPVNTLSGIAITFLIFSMIVFGGRSMSGQAMSDSLGGLIVGFFLWTMAVTSFSGLAWSVTRESQWGTLEKLYMSPFGYGRVMFGTILVRLLESFLWGGAILVFMLALTRETVQFDPLTVVPVTVLAIAPAIGIGFVFGGLALLYKRIENAFNVLQFVLIALIVAPSLEIVWLRLLPLSQGSYLLTRAMQGGTALWEFSAFDLALLVGTGVGYLAIGYAFFVIASRRARKRGMMGKY